MADYTFIDLVAPEFAERNHSEGFNEIFGNPILNDAGMVTVTHVVFSLLALAVIVVLALWARRKYATKEGAMIPEGKLTVRNVFEVIFDATLSMMSEMMGKENAKRYFPLIAALAVFILVGNFFGLIPGMAPPTNNLNTNLACAATVFVIYNIAGIREHGLGYLKHFMGPIWLIAPLMLVIELVGHAFRPISLSVRLTGNMTGDHMVLGVFADMASSLISIPFLLPVPFYFMGILVSLIQALVFCLLSAIYISLAVSHEGH
jgi:F-type H+-transporting ATPase subunit a